MCNRDCLKYCLLLILSFFILLFVFLKFGPKIPLSIVTQEKGQPLIVEGTGKVPVTFDHAKITVGVTESGLVLSKLLNNVGTKAKSLTDALKKAGVGESDIKTTSFNVYPQYNYHDTPQTITGYQVSTNYEVTIKNMDKINEVVAAATASGANMVGGISFEVNEKTKKEKLQEARVEAVKAAKEKAEGLAKAAGISLGKIINISESQNNEPRPVAMYAEKAGLGGETSTSPNIEPGQTELSVTVSLSYEIR